MKKYVLGGGISGLVFAFYNPHYTIISDDVGGRLSNEFLQNTIYLHDTPDSVQFLQDVGVEFTKRTHTIKYIKNGEILTDITKIDKLAFIKKKMGDTTFEVKDMNLSTSDYYISVLQFEWNSLIEKLSKKINIIKEKVIRITDDNVITTNNKYEYEELISTLPAYIFWKIYYQDKDIELKTQPITFVLADSPPKILQYTRFDLAYFIDNKYAFTRVNSLNGKYLYEFTGRISKEEAMKHLPKETKIFNYYVDDNAVIFTNEANIPPKNIRFLGRFAEHNHSKRTDIIIKEAKFSYDFRHIWNRQKEFFNRVDDLSSIETIEQREQKTQHFLLHLMSELSEVLEETNYKTHKAKREVNVDKIKEELIDAFKYLLSMFLVWKIDMKDFVEEFNRKSDIVDSRFEKIKRELDNEK